MARDLTMRGLTSRSSKTQPTASLARVSQPVSPAEPCAHQPVRTAPHQRGPVEKGAVERCRDMRGAAHGVTIVTLIPPRCSCHSYGNAQLPSTHVRVLAGEQMLPEQASSPEDILDCTRQGFAETSPTCKRVLPWPHLRSTNGTAALEHVHIARCLPQTPGLYSLIKPQICTVGAALQ